MATPLAYNNTTSALPSVPHQPSQPPEQAVVLKRYSDGGVLMVKGKHDTVTSLLTSASDGHALYRGAGPHLEAYLRTRPEGYPKPGELFRVPPLWDFAGKQPRAALEAANALAERQDRRRGNEQSTRQADGTTRLAAAIAPTSTRASGIMQPNRGHRLFAVGALAYGRSW